MSEIKATDKTRQVSLLELMSYAEATTLILLVCVAMPLKYLGDWQSGVRLLGPVHGFAFLVFVWSAIEAISANPSVWTWLERLRLFLGAMLPFGGILNAPMIRRKSRHGSEQELTRC